MATKKAPEKKRISYSKGFTDVSGMDGFYRNNINMGRWSYAVEIFKNNFARLVGLNLIMLLFVAPIVYLLFVRDSQQFTLVSSAPFSANLGVGYAPYANLLAQQELIMMTVNTNFFIYIPLVAIWLAVGLSGGMFVMRNIVWGEDVSLIKDFILGVKRNYFKVLAYTVFFALLFSAAWIGLSYLDYVGALGGGKTWYQIVFKILLIILIVLISLWFLTALPMTVTFKGDLFATFKNGVLITGVLIPINLFFAILALLPFALLIFGSSFLMISVMVLAIIGVSYFMLVWTVYSQWVYEKFVNPTVKDKYKPTEEEIRKKTLREEAKANVHKAEEGYETVGEGGDYGGEGFTFADVKPVTDTAVSVKELPEVFTIADMAALKESKREMIIDAEEYSADPKAYVAAHKDQFPEEEETPNLGDASVSPDGDAAEGKEDSIV